MFNNDYDILVEDILNNDDFQCLNCIEHHGTSRMKHSKRVSYYSYLICKKLHLDYVSAARAGLLHDFFLSENDRTKRERFLSVFTHPKKALNNTTKHFDVNFIEQNIIVSHMFPLNIMLPKYMESWIVSFVDKVVGTYEFLEKFSLKQLDVPNLYLLLLIRIFS